MTNWCENILTIYGNIDVLKKFKEENINEYVGLDLLKSVYYDGVDKYRYNNDNEYAINWNYKNIGTSSRIICNNDLEIIDGLTIIILRFETRHKEPDIWLKKVAKKYVELYFDLKYAIYNNDISGILLCKENKEILNKEGKYGDFYGLNDIDNN